MLRPALLRSTLSSLLFGAALPAIALAAAPGPAVTVSGLVEHPLTLRAEALRQWPPARIVSLQLPGNDGVGPASPGVVRGVRLRDLLDQARIVQRDHTTDKKLAIIAGATDGYKVVFSWNEVFNSAAGDSMLVLFERDGKPLAANEGPLALIAGKDIKTAARHVRWLQSIEVRQVVD